MGRNPNQPRRPPAKLRRLYKRQCGVCPLCEKPIERRLMRRATIDHIIPKSHGGPGTDDNIQLVHEECNYRKGDTCPGCPYCQSS